MTTEQRECETILCATENGNLDLLQQLLPEKNGQSIAYPYAKILVAAMSVGATHILEWLEKQFTHINVRSDSDVCFFAAINGHTPALAWAMERGFPFDREENGHMIDVLCSYPRTRQPGVFLDAWCAWCSNWVLKEACQQHRGDSVLISLLMQVGCQCHDTARLIASMALA